MQPLREVKHMKKCVSKQAPGPVDIASIMNDHGKDDVGAFVVDGMYSSETQQITLTKVYKRGTGDPTENFGHKVAIQLTWNSNHN